MYKRNLSFLWIAVACLSVAVNSKAQQHNSAEKYTQLENNLATGWNTWNTRSVLSYVLLPEAFSINLELEDKKSNEILREALIGRRGEGVEIISPGMHSYDGSYTELTVSWRGDKVKIETAGKGNNLVVLVTPLNKNPANELLIRPAMLWNKNGIITKSGNSFTASLPDKSLSVYITNTIADAQWKDSLVAAATLTKNIGISVGEKKSVQEITAMLAVAKQKLVATYTKYKEDAELYKAMQNVLAWDVIYEPTQNRVIAPVSRIWSVDAKGWVIFDWDTYFASWMFATEDKQLAYANAIAITDEITDSGFIPNYAAGLGKTNDRSQPPVGAMMIREIYRKYKEKWLLEYTFDKLLTWNRWWIKKRDINGYLVWGSGLLKTEAPKWESGLDNSTMYDGAPYDSTTRLQQLADVGLMSLYIEDCRALADIAKELNKPDVEKELHQRAATYAASLKTLWNDKFGLFLNKRLDNGEFSYRLSPTLFYPLLAGVATQQQAERMVAEHFYNPKEFWGEWILPSSARNDTAYHDNTYWRGRIWAPMNFLVYLGFRNYNSPEAKKDLVEKSKKLLLKSWLSNQYIYENYNAETGEGDDVANSDKFYHWGALLGFISLIDDGFIMQPLQPLNKIKNNNQSSRLNIEID